MSDPLARQEERVRRFGAGDLIASSTLQAGMRYFETSFGSIAFRTAWGVDVTLGGAWAHPSDRAELWRRFLARSKRPVLCYLREDELRAIGGETRRLHAVGMGVDRRVDLEALVQRPSKQVRGALKHARRAEVSLREESLSGLDRSLRQRLEQISTTYLSRAECTVEMSFLNRPMSYAADGLRRLFVLRRRGEPFGFAVLNPVFEDGRVDGYLLDILRLEPTKVWGVWLSTVHELATRMLGEGHGLTAGFTPLCRVPRAPALRSRALEAQMRAMTRLIGPAKYLVRLRELKAQIPGAEEPRFVASYTRSLLTSFAALTEVSGVGVRYLFGPDLLRVLSAGVRGEPMSGARS